MFDEYGQEALKQEEYEKGIQEGIRRGESERNLQMAQKLLILGVLTEEQIAQTIGLSLEQVKTLDVSHT